MTAHTCHVCVLPSSAHLRSGDDSEIRLKSFQVGPTAHVLEQSPLATALWHPLSQPGVPTLVTITKDACVRQWELDINNRYTFDEPAIAIDLKKLANATTTHADFSASKYGVKKGFSPDEVEMQVAAAAFGGSGNEDENGWSSMTLWFAMSEGDTYALSPFLPSQFRAPSTLLPALTTAVVAKARAIQHDPHSLESEKRNAEAQKKWLAELDVQEPFEFPGETEFDVIEVYSRPQRLGAIPKLQGPFSLTPEPDFGEITDIHVIAPTIDREEWFGEDLEDAPLGEEGLSLGVVCLATNTGKIHVCLDLGGVEAEWLPVSRSRSFGLDDIEDGKELLVFESVDLTSTSSAATSSAAFTTSPSDRYELFVTTPSGVFSLDFKPWIGDLEAELANSSDSGGEFRLDVILDSGSTLVQQPIDLSAHLKNDKTIPTAAIAIMDPSLEYFLFTTTPSGPHAATLEIPSTPSHPYEPEQLALPPPEPREPYQPPKEFYTHSQIKNFLGPSPSELTRATMKGPLRFSAETLQIVTEAHRILSHETNQLGLAAADLFRRCERLRSELYDQVIKVREIAARVDAVTGDDGRDGERALAHLDELLVVLRIEPHARQRVQPERACERGRRRECRHDRNAIPAREDRLERDRRASHHERARQTRAGGDGDCVEVREGDVGGVQGAADRGHEGLEVGAGGDLRDHAAEAHVLLDGGGDLVGQQGGAADDPDAGLVARGLDAEDERLRGHVRIMTTASVPLGW